MNYEPLFWIGVILATPLWYMLARTFFSVALNFLIRSEKITLEVSDNNGHTSTQVFYVNKSDDLIRLLDAVKKGRSV